MKKYKSIVLVLRMIFATSVPTFATDVDTEGGTGETPVYLSSTEDGSIDGTPAATAMSVTVPTALPMAMKQAGDTTTADNCKIVNNSYSAVRVKFVTITTANCWTLTAFGDKSTLASKKIDSNKLGFAIAIGGGNQVATDTSNASTQMLISALFLQKLATCQFVENQQNVIMIGNPGRGKTHLAIALGQKACTQGYNVLFKNAATLSTELCEAKDNYHLGKLERTLAKADLLILDELSYLSFNRHSLSCLLRLSQTEAKRVAQ